MEITVPIEIKKRIIEQELKGYAQTIYHLEASGRVYKKTGNKEKLDQVESELKRLIMEEAAFEDELKELGKQNEESKKEA